MGSTSDQVLLVLVTLAAASSQQISKPGWHMDVSRFVTATPGSDVTLPCIITHPLVDYTGNITVSWKRDCTTIFKCLVPQSASTCPDTGHDHYRLLGVPRDRNLSLQIQNVSIEDSMSYVCRLELEKKDDAYENRPGTILLVAAAEPSSSEACTPSYFLIAALGALCGLLFAALLALLGYMVWGRRGQKMKKPVEHAKVPDGPPPPIPLETPQSVPIYENIPRAAKPRTAKPSV
ncbi:sialic acid-binding Ig-like lectin 15 [Ambystoma mexicanum]|uniref:sialic acid-binding Ig-like lectin 15 n=1 Tax=Ambystoma mexicanum TaxID=8296 RepID=UPI0037E8ACEC